VKINQSCAGKRKNRDQELLEQSPAEWLASEESRAFRERIELQTAWAAFLGKFKFDCWFTLTYRNPAQSGILAIDRAVRLINLVVKRTKLHIAAFVVAEQHRSGTYHCHGLMRLGALSVEIERTILRYFWQVGFDLFGRNSFAMVRDSDAVRIYVSKYLTKKPADHRFVNIQGVL
jgi:hypothetical protein